MNLRMVLSLLALSLGLSPADAQLQMRIPPSDTLQMLTTRDGSLMMGRIVEIGEEDIVFETDLGRIAIPRAKIKAIKEVPISAIKNNAYWFPNPNATRLFFAPTARMLNRGSGYLSNHYLFFPAFTYGFTNHVTLGGGGSLFPGISFHEQVFYLMPKLGWQASPNLDLSIGALILKLPSDRETAGILYGVGTYGTSDQSLTVGLGYGFIEGELAQRPVVMLGGEKRLSRRTSLISENWIYPGEHPLVSCGIRFFGESLSVDFALINTLGKDAIFPGIPYLGFAFQF